jgi:NAD(P)H-dependent flavin oxidoreductase YrpB (nitropropane dioxygenase family)
VNVINLFYFATVDTFLTVLTNSSTRLSYHPGGMIWPVGWRLASDEVSNAGGLGIIGSG